MKFRTEIPIKPFSAPVDYSQSIFAIGSCFASAIGARLAISKFDIAVNPFGVLFNAHSIRATFDRLAQCKLVEQNELNTVDGLYFHYDFHGSFSDVDALSALANMNRAVQEGAAALDSSSQVIITLGSSWVYELSDSGAVVANCHKMPPSTFVRRAMSVEQVVESLAPIVERYSDKQFIFTVSPVRHLSDSFEDNSLSKATLRVATAEIVARYGNASYFPSYEIMMDDLRDYRFYKEDMAHPTREAEEYIWLKFREAAISPEANARVDSIAKIVRAAEHRPINRKSAVHKAFCQKMLWAIDDMGDVDFSREREHFEGELNG